MVTKRTVISSTELAGGLHKVSLEKERGTRHLIHICNDKTVQHLEYDDQEEVMEAFRDYNLIVRTIQSVLEQYGQK